MKNISKSLKPIFILFKANWKKLTRSKIAFLSTIIRMIGVVLMRAGFFVYVTLSINSSFMDKEFFIYGVICQELIISLAIIVYATQREMVTAIKTSELDHLILKPTSLNNFIFFRYINVHNIFLAIFQFLLMIFLSIYFNFSFLLFLKSMIFIVLATITHIYIWNIIFGMTFFMRSVVSLKSVKMSFIQTFSGKPYFFYPNYFQVFFIYFIPFLVLTSGSFEILLGQDDFLFWGNLFFWTGFSMFLNYFIWKKGLEKYESMG